MRNAREALVAALLTAADNELTAQHLAPATRLVDAAASINSGAPGLDVLRRRMREQQAAARSAGRSDGGTAGAPACSRSRAADGGEGAGKAGHRLSPSRHCNASARWTRPIPQRALEQLISGWVELQFTVATDGTVHDVVVVDSQPRVTFDKSAIAALRRWRYAPVMRDGVAVPQRAHIRMRFTATDQKR